MRPLEAMRTFGAGIAGVATALGSLATFLTYLQVDPTSATDAASRAFFHVAPLVTFVLGCVSGCGFTRQWAERKSKASENAQEREIDALRAEYESALAEKDAEWDVKSADLRREHDQAERRKARLSAIRHDFLTLTPSERQAVVEAYRLGGEAPVTKEHVRGLENGVLLREFLKFGETKDGVILVDGVSEMLDASGDLVANTLGDNLDRLLNRREIAKMRLRGLSPKELGIVRRLMSQSGEVYLKVNDASVRNLSQQGAIRIDTETYCPPDMYPFTLEGSFRSLLIEFPGVLDEVIGEARAARDGALASGEEAKHDDVQDEEVSE